MPSSGKVKRPSSLPTLPKCSDKNLFFKKIFALSFWYVAESDADLWPTQSKSHSTWGTTYPASILPFLFPNRVPICSDIHSATSSSTPQGKLTTQPWPGMDLIGPRRIPFCFTMIGSRRSCDPVLASGIWCFLREAPERWEEVAPRFLLRQEFLNV